MNTIKKIISGIASFAMLTATLSVIPANTASAEDNALEYYEIESIESEDYEISPYTNYVFSDHKGYVYNGYMKCNIWLVDYGTVTVQTILQRLDTNTGTWRVYNNSDTGYTYNGITNTTHFYYCNTPSGSNYRCKYILSGTVNGKSSTIIGFSDPTYI